MNKRYLDNPETVQRFYCGREKLIYIKETLFLSNSDLSQRFKIPNNLIREFFYTKETPPATLLLQEKVLDRLIEGFNLNPEWIYGESRKRFKNFDKITMEEICMLAIDTPKKRRDCVRRFENACKAYELTYFDLAVISGVTVATILKWLRQSDPGAQVKYINLILEFCKLYRISTKWIFMGIGKPTITKRQNTYLVLKVKSCLNQR